MPPPASAGPRRSAWRGSGPPSSSTTSPPPWTPPTSSTRSTRPVPRAWRSPGTSASARPPTNCVAHADGLGGLDIVVNNAGITRDRMLFNMSDEDWDAVIAVHLRGHFLLTRNAATYWRAKAKEAGGSVYGRIINTSSEAGLVGPGRPGELRRGQGGHHGADAVGGAGTGPLRRARQRDLPAGPHRDDRRRLRRRHPDRRSGAGRPAVARARRHAGAVPGVPGGRGRSTVRCSSSTGRR